MKNIKENPRFVTMPQVHPAQVDCLCDVPGYLYMKKVQYSQCPEFDRYEIGNDGSVYSLDYNHTGKRKVLKQYLDDDGYPCVYFVVMNKRYKRSVHRIVAKLFVPNPENKPQVNHKDGIRNNNNSTNLEWVTSSENTIHGYVHNGRVVSDKVRQLCSERFGGVNNPKSKITEIEVKEIRNLRKDKHLLKHISNIYNISIAQVSSIVNFKSWKNV